MRLNNHPGAPYLEKPGCCIPTFNFLDSVLKPALEYIRKMHKMETPKARIEKTHDFYTIGVSLTIAWLNALFPSF